MSAALENQQAVASRGKKAPEGFLELLSLWVSKGILVAMVLIILAEVTCRNVFQFSLNVTDEVGGYLLVALCFISLSICQRREGFHRVEFLQMRLSDRQSDWSNLAFNLLSIAASCLLVWAFVLMVASSWASRDAAPTLLETPLWIPRLVMPMGMVFLTVTLIGNTWFIARRLLFASKRKYPA
jgi:TRAP-type C4-dicarboxylate transport system permease small subunit